MPYELSERVTDSPEYLLASRTGTVHVSWRGVAVQGVVSATLIRKIAPTLEWAASQLQSTTIELSEFRDRLVSAGVSITVDGLEAP